MKNSTTTIINAANLSTATLEENLRSAVSALVVCISKDESTSKVESARQTAANALTALNKSRQNDCFSAALAAENPVVALAETGVYAAAGYKIDDDCAVSYADRDSLLSLNGFVQYAAQSAQGGLSVTADAMWRGKVKDACHLAMVKLAQGLKADAGAYLDKVEASGNVRDMLKTASKNNDGEISYKLTQQAIQDALDAIIFDTTGRDDGKNRYRVDRASCRWLEASFDVNKTTAAIVNPKDEGMYARMFQIIRHVVAGMPLTVEVAEKVKKASK